MKLRKEKHAKESETRISNRIDLTTKFFYFVCYFFYDFLFYARGFNGIAMNKNNNNSYYDYFCVFHFSSKRDRSRLWP